MTSTWRSRRTPSSALSDPLADYGVGEGACRGGPPLPRVATSLPRGSYGPREHLGALCASPRRPPPSGSWATVTIVPSPDAGLRAVVGRCPPHGPTRGVRSDAVQQQVAATDEGDPRPCRATRPVRTAGLVRQARRDPTLPPASTGCAPCARTRRAGHRGVRRRAGCASDRTGDDVATLPGRQGRHSPSALPFGPGTESRRPRHRHSIAELALADHRMPLPGSGAPT